MRYLTVLSALAFGLLAAPLAHAGETAAEDAPTIPAPVDTTGKTSRLSATALDDIVQAIVREEGAGNEIILIWT